jgi:alpha-beta hydrolase superfamily lysophospholipase
MNKLFEGQFKGYDGARLFFQKWATVGKSKASLIITHGQAEHSGCYQRVVTALEDLPLDIYAWDLRGHGRSDGLRGYAKDFQEYIKDFEAFLTKLTVDMAIVSKPVFLLGHSMGGLIQFKTLCERPGLPITAQILSSPMFGVTIPVPSYKEKAAELIRLLFPKMTLNNEIAFENLTRDLDVIREYENDNLRHNRISAGVYLGAKGAISEARAMAERVKAPTLFLLPEKDLITDTQAALEIFSRVGAERKDKHLYPDRMHELFNDLGREEVFTELKSYLQNFIN